MRPEAALHPGAARQPGRRPVRLAVFTSHPIQYQAPLFRALAQRPEVEPTVFFGSRHGVDVTHDPGFGREFRWDIPLLDGYRHVFLENRARRPDVSRLGGIRVPEIGAQWTRARFDAALVLGWHTLGHLQALRAARAAGLPLVVRGESTLEMAPTAALRARLRAALWLPCRRPLYRRAFRHFDAVLATGTRNAAYFRHFGVPEARITLAPYCVENERFALPRPERARARARIRPAIGAQAEDVVFLVSGKLIPRKRPLDAVQALGELAREVRSARLVFLGDGPLRPAVEEEAAALGVVERVTLTGFVNQSALPEWYAAADCLLHPSGCETWGVVVNEGMAAGLPVLVSDAVGCAPDLVRPGRNGAIVPVGDVRALTDAMRHIVSLPAPARERLGRASAGIVGTFTFERVADALGEVLTRLVPAGARA